MPPRQAKPSGETTLCCDSDHTLLASATFSVTRDHDAWRLVIGGLQGHDVTFLMR